MSRMIRYHIETLVRSMAESIGKSGALGCHAGFDQVHAEHGDHGTVVGAELDLRDADVDTVILAEFE